MLSCFVPAALLFLSSMVLSSAATLDDLKQLEITCYVPSYLTQGLRLQNVEITYDEIQENEDQNHPLPLYSIQYGNGWNATFTIESAREGIGDRNIMLREIDEDFRAPLVLHYIEDFSYKQIADVLAIPLGTVQSRIARAKIQLLRRLSETGPPLEQLK